MFLALTLYIVLRTLYLEKVVVSVLSHTPICISDVHFMVNKLKHGIPVERREVDRLFRKVLADKHNYGWWVKREIEESLGLNYVSVVYVGPDWTGRNRVVGYRLENKKSL